MSYSVTIEMNDDTVSQLTGSYLYALRAVQGPPTGQPVVWFQTNEFSAENVITWADQYQAYTSSSQVMPYAQIMVDAAFDTNSGQTLNVTSGNGTGTVVGGGTPDAIGIANRTSSMFTCGISGAQPYGGSAPMSAFPLLAYQTIEIAPLEQVFLMFGNGINTGAVIQQSFNEGILVDLTGTPSQTLIYDFYMGWIRKGGNQAITYPTNQNLQPLLIQS